MAKVSVRNVKVVTTFSAPSWPERLPLCLGYESETIRLPQRRRHDPELHSKQKGEGHWHNGQVLQRGTHKSVMWREREKECWPLVQQKSAFYTSTAQ